ncbi:MAG: hypothetical protein HY370_04290 [Proteobacteria bacterium]|nr:hypothetical protein [Pseudomonadota bacterium]
MVFDISTPERGIMGHVRLGKLPTSQKWKEIIALLGDDGTSAQALAEAVANAAIAGLEKAANDKTLVAVYQMLVDIPQAAKEKDFQAALKKIGIDVPQNPTLDNIAEGMAKTIDAISAKNGLRTDLGTMAKQSAISTFLEMSDNASQTLWGSNTDDMQSGIASFTDTARFGELSQRFHADLSHRILNYHLDREMPRHVSVTGRFPTIADMNVFQAGLRKHCMESSMIMRPFARDWLGKQYSSQAKDGSRPKMDAKKSAGFIYVSMNKIAKEQRQRGKDA